MENKLPTGKQLMTTLVDLFADQTGVDVSCEIEQKGVTEE